MKGLKILLFLASIALSSLAFSDKNGFSPNRLFVSIYNNSSNGCTLLSNRVLSGGMFNNNRVPIYIPAGSTESFALLSNQKQSAIVRLSYECGVGRQITFTSSTNKTATPAARGSVENSQNMQGYFNVIYGVNVRSIYWVLEVTL